MAITDEQTPIWEEIDRAESYLVCCMFEESASSASSILKRLLENFNGSHKGLEVSKNFGNEWDDMVESAGMVLVQSLKQLQRACFQMSESLSTTVQGYLEEFLNNWIYMDDRYYPLSGAEASVSDTEGSSFMFSIGVDEYLEVVELYVITLLATTLKDTDLAISWVEKAMLPMEKRQELLRRLQSLNSSMVTSSSQTSKSPQLPDEYFLRDQKPFNEHQKDIESEYLSSGVNITAKEEILKFSRQRVPCFWWFRNIRLKLGNTEVVVPTGKIMLASLLLLTYYFTRKKQAVLKR
ncbi:hypothetical protein DH2020_014736 [Rehmannia glutinosa]|uniref:Uncharacterized protein n=1 Tax=Rehmannia glutinosa TaxID=99300 RepID=A0ABR0WZU1_REHGL